MENVVPGHLQRLRAADIVRIAGLAAASVGQEYYHSGAVHSTFRRGATLLGIVELPLKTRTIGAGPDVSASGTTPTPSAPTDMANGAIPSQTGPQRFPVEVEYVSAGMGVGSTPLVPSWLSKCACSSYIQGKGSIEVGQESSGSGQANEKTGQEHHRAGLCAHGAALLYQWLAHPSLFLTQDTPPTIGNGSVGAEPAPALSRHVPFSSQARSETVGVKSIVKNEESDVTTGARKEAGEVEASLAPTDNLLTLFSQLSLSDLRAVAREYGLVVSGMPRQQLAESIQAEMQKPDAVRRVAATLEKSQRQCLAALILAGGAMSDDDLRGLFERFSLGQPSQLQNTLLALQNRALLFRTSLNASNIPLRPNHGLLNSALLDIGWYVPLEVRHALRVSVPATPFDMTNVAEQGAPIKPDHNILHHAQPSGPLPMLLLVARLLDGHIPTVHETWYDKNDQPSDPDQPHPRRDNALRLSASGLPSTDGSVAMPSPEDLPPFSLLQELQERIFPQEDIRAGYVPPQSTQAQGQTGQVPGKNGQTQAPNGQESEQSIQEQAPNGQGPNGQGYSRQGLAQSLRFLCFVVRVLGIADLLLRGDKQVPALRLRAGTAERLLGADWAKVLQTLFRLWLTETSYGDLYDLTDEHLRLRCRTHSGMSLQHQPVLRSSELDMENRQARQYVVSLLAQAPLNQWMSFSSFARFVYRLNPLFLQRRQLWSRAATGSAVPQWWLEAEEGRPLRPLQLSDWLRAENIYLRRIIAGPLHWWGACDIVTSPDGTLLAFRLTPMASWLFNNTDEPTTVWTGLDPVRPDPALSPQTPAPSTQSPQIPAIPSQLEAQDAYVAALDVTDTCEILVPCSVPNWPVIRLLELFMEGAGVVQGSLAYRISAQAFGLALGRGLRPLVLLQLLRLAAEVHAGSAIHKAQLFTRIAAQLEQWLAGYSRVRLYTGVTLLETVDLAAMREVVATTSLETSIVQHIHPTLCIVTPHTIGHIVEELKQRGQSPLLHDEDL